MTAASIGYPALNLGLNNQKLALAGLFDRARRENEPLVLPQFSLFDPRREEHPAVDFGTVFDLDVLARFADGFGIEIAQGPADVAVNGWDCFLSGGGCVGRDALRGLAAINDFVCQLFNHLVPHVINTDSFKVLSDVVFRRLGIKTIIQLRIEKDWIEYSDRHLKQVSQPGEDFLPSFHEILNKVKNTTEIPSQISYVVCDEANLPVSKDVIRDEVKSSYGITLVWKSDILSSTELSELSILELALIDFEMSAKSPYFVGLSRSSFSDLALFEAFCRTRRSVRTHYIYNLPGDVLGRRMDNASQLLPSLVVNRLFARQPLIDESVEDCRWPATLTTHISRYGDFVSEGCRTAGVRGGMLVSGVRGGDEGFLIEGFGIKLDASAPVGIEYRALLGDGSWTPWVQSGGYVGTRGENRQIRGYSVRLTGPFAGRYDCFCAGSFVGFPDLIIVRNGEDCCATSSAKIEAVHIVFRPALKEWTSVDQHLVFEDGHTKPTEVPASALPNIIDQIRQLRLADAMPDGSPWRAAPAG